MNVQLTALWTLGLIVTVGSLLRVDPSPWIWIGLAIMAQSIRLIVREINRIRMRSSRMEDVAIGLIKRGEIDALGTSGHVAQGADATPVQATAELSANTHQHIRKAG